MNINRQIGSIYLIVGTEIGAGILALPILIVHIGILKGTIILLFAWAIMLYTALLWCEVNCAVEGDASFGTLTQKFIGKYANIIFSFIFWLTLSSIAMAYISAAGSIISHIFAIKEQYASIIFVLIFGICVVIGTIVVDYLNRVLLTIKIIAFIFAIMLMLSVVSPLNLKTSGPFISIISCLPAIMCVFILHNIIPTIRTYLYYDKKTLQRCIIIGSIIPLILYLLWVISLIGDIPATGSHSFSVIIAEGKSANVGELLNILSYNTSNKTIISTINFVASISVTTSFLGTSISLFHFLKDISKNWKNKIISKYVFSVILAFIIPLLIVIIDPNIFITALSYAGAGAVILFVIFPIIIVKNIMRKTDRFHSSFMFNKILLNTICIIGIGIVLIEFIY